MVCRKFKEYRIDSTRYVFHEYNDGIYFVTICTKNRMHFFGSIQRDECCGLKMHLSDIGNYLDDNIRNVSLHHPDVLIPSYVIMPNHVHLIVVVNTQPPVETERAPSKQTQPQPPATDINLVKQQISLHKGKLSNTIGGIKSAVTRYANQNKIQFGWQPLFYDRIIRKQSEMDSYVHYIGYNVINWGVDEFYCE